MRRILEGRFTLSINFAQRYHRQALIPSDFWSELKIRRDNSKLLYTTTAVNSFGTHMDIRKEILGFAAMVFLSFSTFLIIFYFIYINIIK
jgi:hypothetical protein